MKYISKLLKVNELSLSFWAVIFFVFDIIHVLVEYFLPELRLIGDVGSIAAIPKLAFCILVYIVFVLSTITNDLHRSLFMLLTAVLIILMWEFKGAYYTLFQLKYLSKLITPILLFILIQDLRKYNRLLFMYLVYITLQGMVVVVATIWDIDLFRTYYPPRFGYSGLYVGANQLAFFYTLGMIVPLYLTDFIKQKYRVIVFSICALAALFSGAKASWYSLFSFVLFILIFDRKNLKIDNTVLGYGSVLFSVVILITFFLSKDWFVDLAEKHGVLMMLTSNRSNMLLNYKFERIISEFNWHSYLIGGANPGSDYIEMDVVDLFLFTGVLGLILYFYFLFKTLFKFSRSNKLGIFVVYQFLFIGFFSGSTFANGINLILLPITCNIIQNKFN